MTVEPMGVRVTKTFGALPAGLLVALLV